MESTLLQTIKFFNSNLGKIVSRKHFLRTVSGNGKFTRDTYRMVLTKSGFLEVVGQGKYKVVKKIPEQLSIRNGKSYIKKTDLEKLFDELDKITEERIEK